MEASMKREAIVLGLIGLLAVAGVLQAQRGQRRGLEFEKPTVAASEAEQRVLGVLQQMRAQGDVYLEVPDTDGRVLRVLAEALGAQHVVEVGTSTGYSALWMAMALQNTGGRLTTLELDKQRAEMARRHFQQAGVDERVTLIEGNAHETVKQIKGPIDMVFLDADKDGYVLYLNTLLPHLRPGGLIVAHNIGMAPKYAEAVTTNPQLDTFFYMHGAGMSVTVKKALASRQ
jgi:caffeoyl-CoA O-methyltransferase